MNNNLNGKLYQMLDLYHSDFSGHYLMSLDFFIDEFKNNISFDDAYKNMIKRSQGVLSESITTLLREEEDFNKYSEMEIKKAVEDAQNKEDYLREYEYIKSVYFESGMYGIYKMFYEQYQEFTKTMTINELIKNGVTK